MIDAWNEILRCPNCYKKGVANLSQADTDDRPTVASVPDGFKIILKSGGGPGFDCETCNVAVCP
jgi:hypothetical protein